MGTTQAAESSKATTPTLSVGLSRSMARMAASLASSTLVAPPLFSAMLPDLSMTNTMVRRGRRCWSLICISTGSVSSSGVLK